MGDMKRLLRTYLSNLQRDINERKLPKEQYLEERVHLTEDRLAQLVAFGAQTSRETATLFGILGYSPDRVNVQPTMVYFGTRRVRPDYVLLREGRPSVVVDLKQPGLELAKEEFYGQLAFYIHKFEIPIGILFNGTNVHVFVNTHLPELRRHRGRFDEEPVWTATSADMDEMIETLCNISREALQNEPVVAARKYIRWRSTRDREIAIQKAIVQATDQRLAAIRTRLQEIRTTPPDYVLTAICEYDDAWNSLLSTATMEELQQFHREIQEAERNALIARPTMNELRDNWSISNGGNETVDPEGPTPPSGSWIPLVESLNVEFTVPVRFRLPSGVEMSVSSWADVLAEASKYVLEACPDLPLPVRAKGRSRQNLVDTVPPSFRRSKSRRPPGKREISANAETYYVYVNYGATDSLASTLYILGKVPESQNKPQPAVTLERR